MCCNKIKETSRVPGCQGRFCASKKESNSIYSLFEGFFLFGFLWRHIHTYTTTYIYKPAALKSDGGWIIGGKWIPILGSQKAPCSFENALRCQVERCQAIWINELIQGHYGYGCCGYYYSNSWHFFKKSCSRIRKTVWRSASYFTDHLYQRRLWK